LLNNGNKQFKPIGFEESGFLVPGDARALTSVNISGYNYLVSTENRKPLRFFKLHADDMKYVKLSASETSAIFYFSGNQKQKIEMTQGSSFLSQTSRSLSIPKGVTKISIYNQQGIITRTIKTP
jgi:hypothetical protein